MSASGSLPVTVLTGFLGSGKTTLLQKLLDAPGGAGAAVLINEFGEIGLDHLLVRTMAGPAVVLQNGCICCTVRSDLRNGLRDLVDARDQGLIPPFDRVLIETTGLADPVPIVQTLVADPMLRHQMHLANLVSTVDGLNGVAQLDQHREAYRQVALADRLALTKSDLCGAAGIAQLRARLEALNPSAPVINAADCSDLWNALLGSDAFDPARKSDEVRRWLARMPDDTPDYSVGDTAALSRHGAAVSSFSVRTTRGVDWTGFAVWLSALVHRHGNRILRIKGILNVPGSPGPVVLNAVQNFIHPPTHLKEWPDDDRSSRLVFIVEGLDAGLTRRSLERFLDRAEPDRTDRARVTS